MILVNYRPITKDALTNENDPAHSYAVEYHRGVERLKKDFGKSIKFVRPGYPKKSKGIDSRMREVNNLTEPTQPMIVPMNADIVGDAGKELWQYCSGRAKLLPNGLWEATGKRSKFITDSVIVDLEKDPELAFFLYYKSAIVKGGQLKVHDPDAEARAEGDKARMELDLQTALYSTLSDETQLVNVALAYELDTRNKHADTIRKDLRDKVLAGEVKKRSDPTARGVTEFLEDLKVTDSVRMRSLLQVATMEKKLVCPLNIYRSGENEIARVPQYEMHRKQDWLAQHLLNPANRQKLQDLLKDVITKDYLDKKDDKEYFWLARMMGVKVDFRSKEDIKEDVYKLFVQE